MSDLLSALGDSTARLVEEVSRSVVEIRTLGGGAGAGIVWRADGLVVTNHHVMVAPRAEVVFADGRRAVGTAIARDLANDLALVLVPATGLDVARVGRAADLRPGEVVLAVGHPFGIRSALTLGIVSRPPRADVASGRLVADILLGPGNSGGPLVDARGRVVGVNAMVAGGRALAVPSEVVELLVARALPSARQAA